MDYYVSFQLSKKVTKQEKMLTHPLEYNIFKQVRTLVMKSTITLGKKPN